VFWGWRDVVFRIDKEAFERPLGLESVLFDGSGGHFLDIRVQCKDDEGREVAGIKDRWMKGKQRRMLLIIFDFFLSHQCVP